MNKTSIATALTLALLGIAGAAQAHQIWLEQPAGRKTAIVRFGEFGENLRETSPGLLDKFGKPVATLLSAKGEQTVDARKAGSGFELPFGAARGDAIIAEDLNYPLYTWKQGDKETINWYRPAARLITGFAEQQPKLTLDLVPTGKTGEFKLFLKGQPKAKTKVTLVTQSGWAKEGHTDEQGLVKFDMPWSGTYVAEVSVNERSPGERPGANGPEKFDGVSYVTTVTYVKSDGMAPIPAGPAATPGK
ncbi:MAG: cobalt ABC transporter substrate-binding protein [Burkholderiales bacterium]|nr:cobalt ABC transporter substrate-binding protein [Burkholderiales bacterium]